MNMLDCKSEGVTNDLIEFLDKCAPTEEKSITVHVDMDQKRFLCVEHTEAGDKVDYLYDRNPEDLSVFSMRLVDYLCGWGTGKTTFNAVIYCGKATKKQVAYIKTSILDRVVSVKEVANA